MLFIKKIIDLNIVKIISGNAFSSGINFFNSLILPPLFLRYMGVNDYSLWVYYLSLSSVFLFINFGLTTYVTNKLQHYYIVGNVLFGKVKNKLLTGFFVLNLLGLLLGFVCFLIPDKDSDLLSLMVLFFISTNIKGMISSLFRCYNKHHIGIYINNFYSCSILIVTYNILLNNSNQYFLISSMILLSFFIIIFQILLLMKRYDFRFSVDFDLKYLYLTLLKSSKFLSFDISNYLKLQVPIILLQSLLNPISVILYTLHRTIANAQYQIVMILNNSLYQDIARNSSIKKEKEMAVVFLFQKKIILLISTLTSSLIFRWYIDIMAFWFEG